MKKIGVFLFLFVITSAVYSYELKYVTHNGFSIDPGKSTELNIFIETDNPNHNWRLQIDTGIPAKWNNIYSSGFAPVNLLPTDEDNLYKVTTTAGQPIVLQTLTAEPFLEEIIIHFKRSGIFYSGYKAVLKIIVDKPFSEEFLTIQQQEQLATRYMPILRMDDGSNCDEPEQFVPKEVNLLLNNSSIYRRRFNIHGDMLLNPELVIDSASKENIAKYSISNWHYYLLNWVNTSYFINLNIDNLPCPVFYPTLYQNTIRDWYNQIKDQYNTQLYASFFDYEGKFVVTYYFFYLHDRNAGLGDVIYDPVVGPIFGTRTSHHLGEWEGMSIVFDRNTLLPIEAATSNHTASHCGRRRPWKAIEKIGDHPVVYVANGAHASFFHPGISDNEGGSPFDFHNGDGMWVVPTTVTTTDITDYCILYDYVEPNTTEIEWYGNSGGAQLEILPRVAYVDTDSLSNFWHLFSGIWGQDTSLIMPRDDPRARALASSPRGPLFCKSKNHLEDTSGIKWYNPLEWTKQQASDTMYIAIDSNYDIYSSSVHDRIPFPVQFNNYGVYRDTTLIELDHYMWEFGCGDDHSMIQNPNYTYQTQGSFSITIHGTKQRFADSEIPGRYYHRDYYLRLPKYINASDFDLAETTLININAQRFPEFVYSTVAVDLTRRDIPILNESNFRLFEDGIEQTNFFNVVPPAEGGGSRLVDIVFIMDNSGSMGPYINAVSANVHSFLNDLNQSGADYALGLTRYGQNAQGGLPIIEDNGVLTTDGLYFRDGVWTRNETSGGFEPGYFSIVQSVAGFVWRPGSQKIIIIVTDETAAQGSGPGYALNDALIACTTDNVMLFALTINSLFGDFTPIADATYGGVYNIYDDYEEVLLSISDIITSNYIIYYQPTNTSFDNVEREVEIRTEWGNEESVVFGSYTPGSYVVINRTENTTDMDGEGQPADQPLFIQVDIEDPVFRNSLDITLYYRHAGTGAYTGIPMEVVDSYRQFTRWQGTIPAASVQYPFVSYYISVFDEVRTVTLPSLEPMTNPFAISIQPNEPPQIDHTPVLSSNYYSPVVISAVFSDDTDYLAETKLFYRQYGRLTYTSIDMLPNNNNYTAFIPANIISNVGAEYYIKATDNHGASRHSGFPDDPHYIYALEEGTVIAGGSISASPWTLANSPYHILSDIVIPEDFTLVIESGVEVVFNAQSKMSVLGTLIATDAHFRTNNPLLGWLGIYFNTSNDMSLLQNCSIENARQSITVEDTDLTVNGLTIDKEFEYLNEAGVSITGNSNGNYQGVSINNYNRGIVISNTGTRTSSTPSFADLRLMNPLSYIDSKGITVSGSVILTLDVAVINDYETGIKYTDAQRSRMIRTAPTFTNVSIRLINSTSRNNNPIGFYLENLAGVTIERSIIYSSESSYNRYNILDAEAIHLCNVNNAMIQNNTIWGINRGLVVDNSTVDTFSHNIIWVDEADGLANPIVPFGSVEVDNSLIAFNNGVYPGENNWNVDPLFVGPHQGYFYLKFRSPIKDEDIGALGCDFDFLVWYYQEYSNQYPEALNHTLHYGWNLIGVPALTNVTGVPPTPQYIFGDYLDPFFDNPYYSSIVQMNLLPSQTINITGDYGLDYSGSYNVPSGIFPMMGYWVRNYGLETEMYVNGFFDFGEYLINLPGINDPYNGWYLLGNPYDVSISWGDGMEWVNNNDGATFAVVYRLNQEHNAYQYQYILDNNQDQIEPWEGFFVKATDPNSQIKFEYPGVTRVSSFSQKKLITTNNQPESKGEEGIEDSYEEWLIFIKALNDECMEMLVVSANEVASDGLDSYDVPKLPSLPFLSTNRFDFSIDNRDWDNQAGLYVRDTKALDNNSWNWNILLDISQFLDEEITDDFVVISFEEEVNVPEGYSYSLINLESGEAIDPSVEELVIDVAQIIQDLNNDSDQVIHPEMLHIPLQLVIIGNDLETEDTHNLVMFLQNYPNPFNPDTRISFAITKDSHVKLEIFNIKGQRVTTLVDEYHKAGTYSVIWDAQDNYSRTVASGVYLYRLTMDREVINKKMLFVK